MQHDRTWLSRYWHVQGFVPRRLSCFLLLLGVCVYPNIRSRFLWVCGSLALGGGGVRFTMIGEAKETVGKSIGFPTTSCVSHKRCNYHGVSV